MLISTLGFTVMAFVQLLTLKIRAIVQNYTNNELSDDDAVKLREIADYAEENNDDFILDELNSHIETDMILKKVTD